MSKILEAITATSIQFIRGCGWLMDINGDENAHSAMRWLAAQGHPHVAANCGDGGWRFAVGSYEELAAENGDGVVDLQRLPMGDNLVGELLASKDPLFFANQSLDAAMREADRSSRVRASGAAGKVPKMTFASWCEAHKYNLDEASPKLVSTLKAIYDSENEDEDDDDDDSKEGKASAPQNRFLLAAATVLSDTFYIHAGDKKDGAPTARRVAITAYTGEPMRLDYWDYPVIVDLDGIEAAAGFPLLSDHGSKRSSDEVDVHDFIVGRSESARVEDGNFVVKGFLYGHVERGRKLIDLADAGHRLQASIGAASLKKDFIREGNDVKVNGRTYQGPVYVSSKTKIREVSIVPIGADPGTSVDVAEGQ